MSDTPSSDPPSAITSPWAAGAAALILVSFFGFSGWLAWLAASATGTDADGVWARILVIFTSFESIAFAAAGFLFGGQLSRQSLRALQRSETERGKDKAAMADATHAMSEVKANLVALNLVAEPGGAARARALAGAEVEALGAHASVPAAKPIEPKMIDAIDSAMTNLDRRLRVS
ncbi:MAG: hypothetical protein CMP81_21790 [Fulvimarina sp.]|nr:hypothetical protein [Fulvimarina sp.]